MYKYIGVVLCNKYELKINFLFLPVHIYIYSNDLQTIQSLCMLMATLVPEYYLIVADLRRNFAAWVAVTVDKRMRFLDEAAP